MMGLGSPFAGCTRVLSVVVGAGALRESTLLRESSLLLASEHSARRDGDDTARRARSRIVRVRRLETGVRARQMGQHDVVEERRVETS